MLHTVEVWPCSSKVSHALDPVFTPHALIQLQASRFHALRQDTVAQPSSAWSCRCYGSHISPRNSLSHMVPTKSGLARYVSEEAWAHSSSPTEGWGWGVVGISGLSNPITQKTQAAYREVGHLGKTPTCSTPKMCNQEHVFPITLWARPLWRERACRGTRTVTTCMQCVCHISPQAAERKRMYQEAGLQGEEAFMSPTPHTVLSFGGGS